MNTRQTTHLILILAAAVGAGSLTALGDQVTLLNDDRLSGSIGSVDGTSRLVWMHPSGLEPVILDPTSIRAIDFDSATRIISTNTPHSVRLTNGDLLHGRLSSLDDIALVLETPYAGTISLNRNMLRSVLFSPTGLRVAYVGPSSIAEWQIPPNVPEGAWIFSNGALHTTRSHSIIARHVAMPKRALIDFTCSAPGVPQFRVDFCSDRLDLSSPVSYSIEVSPVGLRLVKNSSKSGRKYIGPTPRRQFAIRRPVRIRIFVDAEAPAISLYVDQDFIHTWRDIGPWTCGGDGFVLKADHASFELSNIRIHDWDGNLPDLAPVVNDPEHDSVQLVNGDVAAGTLESIIADAALIRTQFTSVSTPLDRIRRIDFATSRAHRARLYASDVRLYYPFEGYLTMSIRSIKDGKISGVSENFGEVDIPLDMFQRVLFNLYRDFDSTEFEEFLF